MTHHEVYKWFSLYFPEKAKLVIEWFPSGKNRIRVRDTNRKEFIFTYRNAKDWRFETLDSFIKYTMEGEKRNG